MLRSLSSFAFSRVRLFFFLAGSMAFCCLPPFVLAQSPAVDPVLNYSTYLPTLHFSNGFVPNNRAIISVDSTGAACVTDGRSLYSYDANGNLLVTVADTVSVAPQIVGSTVFRDGQGNCYLGGQAAGNAAAGTFGSTVAGIAKFSPAGTLVHTTTFGGSPALGFSIVSQIAADSSGNTYITGTTSCSDFPTKNAIQNLLQGGQDAFIMKIDPTGTILIYSTFFGSNSAGHGIAINSGNAYITGFVLSGGTIPVTAGVFQGAPKAAATTAFVAEINSVGSEAYGTYLGGSGGDQGVAIAVDGTGNAYVGGSTGSSDFPTQNPFQSTIGTPNGSGFVTKLAPDGSSLVYSTYLGGTDISGVAAIAVDSAGAAYVSGPVSGSNFPLLNPIQSEFLNTSSFQNEQLSEIFITAFTSAGSALQYSTFFGGFGPTLFPSIGVDGAHNVYLGGRIDETAQPNFAAFPLLAANNGLYQPFFPICGGLGCGSEAFLAKISPQSGTALASPSAVDFGSVRKGSATIPAPILIANVGSTNLQVNNTTITGDYSINSNRCTGALNSALHCEVDVVFSPTAGGTRTGVLTLTSTAPDSPRSIQLTGIGAVPLASLNPTTLALTSPAVGTAGPVKTVVLSNTGNSVMNIAGLAIVGANAGDFSETHDCGGTLAAGSSCNVNLSYKASSSNQESASLQFTDDAAGSPQTIALTGTISVFGLMIAPNASASATVSAGQPATYNLMIGASGFTGAVTLTCTGAPTGASCNVPGSENLSSTATAFQASVTTTARSVAVLQTSPSGGPLLTAVAVVCSLLLFLALGSLGRKRTVALAAVGLWVLAIVSCGGGGNPHNVNGTPAGTYTLTVTANSANLNQSLNLTLTVN